MARPRIAAVPFFYGCGGIRTWRRRNIDDPIKDRELLAMVWMTVPRRLIAYRPFAQMVEGWVHHDVEKRARPPAGANHGFCAVGCREGDGCRCQAGSPPYRSPP